MCVLLHWSPAPATSRAHHEMLGYRVLVNGTAEGMVSAMVVR